MSKHEVSKKEAHKAAETLRDPKASKCDKSEAGSELSKKKNQGKK
ncbi:MULTISPECIES: hypothetical protein [Commensalibacter]|nr:MULTISPECIES: hypothetical protein [Commensalibacter]